MSYKYFGLALKNLHQERPWNYPDNDIAKFTGFTPKGSRTFFNKNGIFLCLTA